MRCKSAEKSATLYCKSAEKSAFLKLVFDI